MSFIGYITTVDSARGGKLQQEGNFPLTPDNDLPYREQLPGWSGKYEFIGSGFKVGDRVLFDVVNYVAVNLRY
jgi:hypothetical protein